MSKIKELRGLIYSHFNSEAALATELGWSRQKLNRITNAEKEPTVRELNLLAGVLNVGVEELAQIFLSHKSPNG